MPSPVLSLNSTNPGVASVSTANITNVQSASSPTFAAVTAASVTASGNVSGVNLTATGYLLESVATAAANVTGTQASGIALTAMNNAVSSAGAAYSVTLPVSAPGMAITVACVTAVNTVIVFPNAAGTTTETINALSANAGITMAALTSTTFICIVAGQWWTCPRVPS